MKKLTFTLTILTAITIKTIAQIPNNGFENWTTVGSHQNPDGWGTMNNTTSVSGIYTATKGTPGNPGSSYLVLTSKTIASAVVNGIAVSGKLDSITQSPISGFAFNQRPQYLMGSWQHMIYGTSQGSISAILTRWNISSSKRDTIAIASQTLSGMAMSWANFSITFSYKNGNNPDTCIIVLKASGASPTANDYLWIDNLAFSGTIAGISENIIQNHSIKIFPNPASDMIILKIDSKSNDDLVLNIYNTMGLLVKTEMLKQNQQQINIAGLGKGLYMVEVKSHNWSEKQKIIIQR